MTNSEFVSMIDKLHKNKSDSNWKIGAIVVGVILTGGVIALVRLGQKKNEVIKIYKSDLNKERAISLRQWHVNQNLISKTKQKDKYIQELEQKNQQLNSENSSKNADG
jgi:hypothetical protein